VSGKSRPPKVYWDTCILLAWIKDETREAGQMENLYSVAREIDDNNIIMLTSVVAYGEIFEADLTDEQRAKLEAVFDRTNTDVVNIDLRVGRRISEIRQFYLALSKQDGRPPICYADAEHLAAATVYKADEFHTFDRKDKDDCRALIGLGNSVAGYPLRVCMPQTEQRGLL